MGYFDRMAQNAFSTDENGRRVFYPCGVWTRGYYVENPAQEQALFAKMKTLTKWNMFLVFLLVFFGVFLSSYFHFSLWVSMLVLVIVMPLFWFSYAKKITAGLTKTPTRMSFKLACQKMAGQFKLSTLIIFDLIFILALISQIITIIFQPPTHHSNLALGIFVVLGFIFFTSLFTYAIILKKKSS